MVVATLPINLNDLHRSSLNRVKFEIVRPTTGLTPNDHFVTDRFEEKSYHSHILCFFMFMYVWVFCALIFLINMTDITDSLREQFFLY